MKSFDVSRHVLSSCLAVAMLAGCGGSQPPIGAGAIPESRAIPTHADRGRSWMLPEAKSEDVLYLSDSGGNAVEIYTYPAGVLVGSLTGLNDPQGACTDRKQNVWIANGGTKQLVEYKHGGTSPIATLSDPSKYPPFACAVDPTTGNLAATATIPPYGGNVVLIYANARGKPTHYAVAQVHHLAYDGYDEAGNLFVDGLNGSCCRRRHPVAPAFAELPKGGASFEAIDLSGGAFYPRPGGVQWDGDHITVVNVNVVYRLQISGSHGDVVGSTELKEPGSFFGSDVSPDAIAKGKIAAADYSYDSKAWNAGVWKYPRGGQPILHLGGTFSGGFYGLAISLSK
ncbi:MAG: hypothetical protein WCC84_03195 [Candidatus Cybelea sp.]